MNIDDIVSECLEFHLLLSKLGEVTRADYYPAQSNQEHFETDIEHSYFLAMISWQVIELLDLELDSGLAVKIALSHDLPEAYIGDDPLFSDTDKVLRYAQEQKTIMNIKDVSQKFTGLTTTLENYYAANSPEVRFVGAMDRLVALMVHINSNKTQFEENGISKEDIDAALPAWRKRIKEFPELEDFCDNLLSRWFKEVTLAIK